MLFSIAVNKTQTDCGSELDAYGVLHAVCFRSDASTILLQTKYTRVEMITIKSSE